ncbi:MAG: DNA alkylation repair protein [Muribaculaceae bacterium]|nr:DNA alkylation repair protein [Muribaculaceae bacterium]
MEKDVTAADLEATLNEMQNDAQRDVLMRFFKTAPGEYGEGDMFLGLKVPQTRAVVKAARGRVPLGEIEKLLYSPWHEARLCGFLLLVEEMKSSMPARKGDSSQRRAARKEIYDFYVRHARQANNWDLVDLSCPYIVGPYLRNLPEPDYRVLYALADSDNLWEQRIAIVSTIDLIRCGIYEPTLILVDKLIAHPHDLIHKAMGWMLRELGKKDLDTMLDYLERRYDRLPRTTLRYAIERLPESQRQFWLKRKR